MKLFNLILCAFALVNGEENNADGVLQRSEQETDYIDADFEAELKMGRNHGRGNGKLGKIIKTLMPFSRSRSRRTRSRWAR